MYSVSPGAELLKLKYTIDNSFIDRNSSVKFSKHSDGLNTEKQQWLFAINQVINIILILFNVFDYYK